MRFSQKKHSLYTVSAVFIFLLAFLCIPFSSHARMSEISEEGLAQVSAQSGISWVIGNSGVLVTTGSYRISDTDHDPVNWIEFNDVTIDDGQGGPFSMDTPESYQDVNSMDIATDETGYSYIHMNLSTHVEPRTYSVGQFVFCDQDLGSLLLENMRRGTSDRLMIGAHRDGGCGIDLEYQTRMDIDSLTYTFNNQPTSLNLSGIHLSQHATGSPEDPTSWIFSGKFTLGDMENNNPVTMDVATVDNGVESSTSIYYNIPMSGSMRIEDVNFGGNSFGPCAIDGITVHHLGLQIPGN